MNPYSCFTLLLCPTWQLLNSEPFSLTGKQLKGQTLKTQQAILQVSNRNPCSLFALLLPSHLLYCLQKFRSGVYNVLVATSIGEEGLDIIEVDLVICFDANVSPLRMIQRMGRTGRKHDGQVDILFWWWDIEISKSKSFNHVFLLGICYLNCSYWFWLVKDRSWLGTQRNKKIVKPWGSYCVTVRDLNTMLVLGW